MPDSSIGSDLSSLTPSGPDALSSCRRTYTIQHGMRMLVRERLTGGSAVGIFYEAGLNLFDFRAPGNEGLDAVLIDL